MKTAALTVFAASLAFLAQRPADAAQFTRLAPVPGVKIISSAQAYPGGRHEASNLVDGNPATEYSSDGKGTETFVEFEFDQALRLAMMTHRDRNDPAIIKTSRLTLFDAGGRELSSHVVEHNGQRAGLVTVRLPEPEPVKRVRWQITGLASPHGTVGGSEIQFYSATKPASAPGPVNVAIRPLQLLHRQDNTRPVMLELDYPFLEDSDITVEISGAQAQERKTGFGKHTFDFSIPASEQEAGVRAKVRLAGKVVAEQEVKLAPVRKLEIYLLPHSHVDIGYTALQGDVEKKQNENLEAGLRLVKASAAYPPDARFKWNVEVLWPIDNYLRTASLEKREALLQAIKAGDVGLDAFYGNILTGLCRPEELLRLMSYAARLSQLTGVKIESAMISDVPGYTWGTVSAMAHAGVKYFSFAPNYLDRMGSTMKEWQNKPFWWKAADGQRVLCWCPSRGYALGHLIGDGEALARFMPEYLAELQTNNYPYDLSHLRWNVHGDNGSPDEKVAEVVRNWNAKYAYPRLILSTTAEAFRIFEARYGDQLPEYTGDYTPYWEDGAGSSARETAMNRASAERLVQAETLWALRNPGEFPAAEFHEAWKNVLLYSEHTWGAHNSVSQPDLPFVLDQWRVKQAFALDADKQSRALLEKALTNQPLQGITANASFDVFNPASWDRTDLVTVPASAGTKGDRILDEHGAVVPSQRLSTGELVFLARNIPAFGARRFRVVEGEPWTQGSTTAGGNVLTSPYLKVQISKQTGAVESLLCRERNREFCDPKASTGLNDYFYLPEADLKGLQRSGPPRISVKESGPLVASLLIESEAPGCRALVREVRLIEGLDRVEIRNLIDKLPVRSKEGVHLGYGFNVPNGVVRMDVGWAVVRPEIDQIPAACKNWFSVQRWVDISNDEFGLTWATVDAPLVQVGGITANLLGSQTDWRPWVQKLEPSQTLYAWVMNNHWHTNYRAEQDGPTLFRFAIQPHAAYDPTAAARFGADCSQPLAVVPAEGDRPAPPKLKLSNSSVVVSALKPADDGKGWILRLFGASGREQTVELAWEGGAPRNLTLTDLSERPGQRASNPVKVPGWGIVTLRLE